MSSRKTCPRKHFQQIGNAEAAARRVENQRGLPPGSLQPTPCCEQWVVGAPKALRQRQPRQRPRGRR